MKKKYNRTDNKFLNRSGFHSDASVHWNINVEGGKHLYTEGEFRLRDCSRSVSIMLDFSDKPDYENSMRKLRIIEESAARAQVALTQARDVYVKAKAKLKVEPESA